MKREMTGFLKKLSCILLSAVLALGTMNAAMIVGIGAEQPGFTIDTTPKRIEIMSRNPQGEMVMNGNMEITELNVAFSTMMANMTAEKTMFNNQDMLPTELDEFYNSTYIYTYKDLTIAESLAAGYTDACDAPPEGQAGIAVQYQELVSKIYYVQNGGNVSERMILRVRRKLTTYEIKSDNTRSSYITQGYVKDEVSTRIIDKNDASLEFSADKKTVKKVNGIATRALVAEYTSEELITEKDIYDKNGNYVQSAYYNGMDGKKESYPGVYGGESSKWGFFTPGGSPDVDTTWRDSYTYGGTGCYIDLGAYYVITNAMLWGGTGFIKPNIQIGDPGNWHSMFSASISSRTMITDLSAMPQADINAPREYSYAINNDARYKNATRYIRIDENSGSTVEWQFFGYKVGELTEYDQGRNGASYPMDYNSENFSGYNPNTSTYTRGKLAKMLDAKNATTYDPHGYLQYVAANSKDLTAKLTTGDAFGANGIFINKPETLENLANFREFVSSYSILTNDGFHRYEYTTGQNDVSMDKFYQKLHTMGVRVNPCIQFSSRWYSEAQAFTAYDQTRNWTPLAVNVTATINQGGRKVANDAVVQTGVDPTKPSTFARHASFMYNYAARYGANKNVDPATLTLQKDIVNKMGVFDEQPICGLDYVEVIENGNEQNKNWGGQMSYVNPIDYAAMCSADFDGHEGTIYTDYNGNKYELFANGATTYLALNGVPVGILTGWSLTLFDNIELVNVDTYTDELLNVIDVYNNNKAYINGVEIGTFAPTDSDSGVLTRYNRQKFANRFIFNLNNKKSSLKLKTVDGKIVGEFTDEYLKVTDDSGLQIGVPYDIYKYYSKSDRLTMNMFVNRESGVAYYNGYQVGTRVNDTTLNITKGRVNDGGVIVPSDRPSDVSATGNLTVVKAEGTSYRELPAASAAAKVSGKTLKTKINIKPTGVKIADVDMKLATGGFLQGGLMTYLNVMKDWFNYSREDGYFAIDVINFHYYNNSDNLENSDEHKKFFSMVVDWVNKNAPGREIWISEFDTDSMDYTVVQDIQTGETGENGVIKYQATNDDVSKLEFVRDESRVPDIEESSIIYNATSSDGKKYRMTLWGGYTDKLVNKPFIAGDKYSKSYYGVQFTQLDNKLYQLTKAQRLSRGSLLLNAYGIDRLSMFQIYDCEGGVYTNSGLTSFMGAESKKLSWYYYSTIRNVLRDFALSSDFSIQNSTTAKSLALQETMVDNETVVWSPSNTVPTTGKLQQYMDLTQIKRNYYDNNIPGNDKMDVYTYKYDNSVRKGGTANEYIYAVWLGSDKQNVVRNFEFDVSKTGLTDYHATLITPTFGSPNGVSSALDVVNGKVKFDLSETIAFVKVTANTYDQNNIINNYDKLASQILKPQKLQLGDISYAKPSGIHDGTEIVTVNDETGRKNLFYKTNMISLTEALNTAYAGKGELSLLSSETSAFLSDSLLNQAMTDAINADNATPIATIIEKIDKAYDVAYNGMGGWKAWQIKSGHNLADKLLAVKAAVVELQTALPTLTAETAKVKAQAVLSALDAADFEFSSARSEWVVNVLNPADEAVTAMRNTPVIATMLLKNAVIKSADFVSQINTLIDGTKAAATPAAAKQQFVLAGQKSRQLYNISADMIKLLKAVNNSCGDTKVAEMTDCINKFENLYNGITRAVEASDRAMTTDNISNMSANANQIYYWNSMPSNNPDSLMQGIKKALPTFAEKATSNTLKLLLAGINSLAVYDSALINNMYSSAAALQMASGVYCDFNTSGVVGASSQNVVINDMLLGNFAKMFDDSIENVPQYVDDIQRWYDLSAQYGSTYLQQPQSITNLMPAYGSEYDVGAVNEGYDLFITLDDYYIVNGAYLYVNSGDVQLEVYDASDGGSGKLLFTYEKTTSAMTTWIRLADGNNVIGDDTRYFTADAKTTPTNKLRFVWKHGGPLAGELAMYGRKAYSTSGNTVPPVAGSLSSNRNRNVTVNLVSGRPEFPNQSISGMSLPSDKPNTTLAAEGKTLPAYDTVTATDPISGNVARYRFVGWFTNVAGTPGNEFTINTPFSTTVSIYGKWAELPAYEQVILTPSMFSTTDITYRKGNIPFMCDQQSRLPSQGEFGLGKATPIPLTIDLGRLMEIKQLTMITGSGTDHNAKYFVSQDNQEYTLVYDKLNVLHSSPDNCYLETQITGNPPVYARYIKMEIGGNTAELFVYASEIDPATLQHTINFVTNVEGMTVPPQAIGHGQFIAIPTMVREGYSFGGWYSDAALSVPFDIAGAVISGRTLYARWISNASHTVTYISNGTVYDVVIGYESATPVITPTPTSTNGSTFQGWYINTLYDLPFQSGATVNSDTILFAKWSQIPSGFIPISANNVVSIDGESNKSNWTYTTDQINKWFDYSRGAISYGSLNTANDGQGEKYTSIVIDLGEVYDLTKFQLVTRYGANTVVVTARMGVTLSTMQDVPLSYEIPNTEKIVDFTPTAARYGRYIELTNSKHYNFREIIIYGSASYTVDATAVNGIVEAGGNGQYSYGETATLTASSSVNGAVFDGWYIDNVKVSDSRSFSVKLYSSVAPVAKFTTPDTPKLSNNSVLLSRGETVSLLLGGTALPVAWTSSNSTVARVTADGTIIAVSSGFAFIKVSSVSGESVVRIVVDNRDVMEINILGAQIRLDLLSQGLRFLTETKNRHLEANYKNVRYGTILIPYDYLTAAGINRNDFFRCDKIWNKTVLDINALARSDIQNGYKYGSVITGFSSDNISRYSTQIVARSYVSYTDESGITKTVYSGTCTRSVYGTAIGICNQIYGQNFSENEGEAALKFLTGK